MRENRPYFAIYYFKFSKYLFVCIFIVSDGFQIARIKQERPYYIGKMVEIAVSYKFINWFFSLLSHNFSEQCKLRIYNGFSHLGYEVIVKNFV